LGNRETGHQSTNLPVYQSTNILKGLEEEREKKPELAETIVLHHALLLAQADARVSLPRLEMEPEEAKALLQQGIPLLQPEAIEVDWEVFAQLCDEICHIASQHKPELGEELERVRAFLGSHPDKRSLVVDYLRGRPLEGEGRVGVNGELLAFVLNNALHPFLRACAEALTLLVDDSLWYRGRCPVCGGQPDFAFLEAGSGARHLLCSRCDSQWLFRRLECPFCGAAEPDKLIYYSSEDEVYRLYVCQSCNRYLKTIDLRQVARKVIPPVERIITVAMDVAAREAGYI
jgi:FdhE protein